MGIQSFKANKRKLKVVKYYLLQNKIMNNLLGRETIENEHKIEKGYLANPESLKNWKNAINYDKIKDDLIVFQIKSTKYKDFKNKLDKQNVEIKKTNANFVKNNNPIKLEEKFITFKDLENFMNSDSYIEGINKEKIEYIFKKGMLIIFFPSYKKNIIKIIYLNEEKNKLINIKFIFYNEYEYFKHREKFEEYNSDRIKNLENVKKAFYSKTKKYEHYEFETKNHEILYEEKNIKIEEIKDVNIDIIKTKITIINNNNENNNEIIFIDNIIENTKDNRIGNDDFDRISCFERNNVKELSDEDENRDSNETKNTFRRNRFLTVSKNEFNELIDNRKIFSINLITPDQWGIPITCNHKMTFKDVEIQAFKQYPELKNKDYIFQYNGKSINRESTLDENEIKGGGQILMLEYTKNENNENEY